MSKRHITLALGKMGKTRMYFQFLPGEETAVITHMHCINIIKAIRKFTAFQLQSAKSAADIIAQSSQKWKQGHLYPSETHENDFWLSLLSQGGQHRHTHLGAAKGARPSPRTGPLAAQGETDLSQ